jgi:ABC-type polysaccharide transport system permease subunit
VNELLNSNKANVTIQKKGSFMRYFLAHWQLYFMIALPLIVLLLFAYGPMYGVILAFKNYKVSLGIWDSPWADNYGFNNFIRFFKNYNFKECLRNTLVVSIYSMVVSIPCSIFLAISLNYAKNVVFKKAVQLVTYCPYFISTIVFVGIINIIMDNRTGVIGSVLYNHFGINVLGSANLFPSLYVWSGVWQGIGFSAIIYIAALASVDMEQHEAAIIDGATLLQRIRYVDIPAIIPTVVIMMILNMGSLLNVGYEKVLAMQNQNNLITSEIITTYSYKVSLVSTFPDYPYSTAIGLFQSLVGLVLIITANKIANKVSGSGFM